MYGAEIGAVLVVDRKERVLGNFEEEDGEGSEGRRGVLREESGGERRFCRGEEVGEPLEDGHLVDEFVDMGNVGVGGEADSGEDLVGSRN